jgi:hypothetical protein
VDEIDDPFSPSTILLRSALVAVLAFLRHVLPAIKPSCPIGGAVDELERIGEIALFGTPPDTDLARRRP